MPHVQSISNHIVLCKHYFHGYGIFSYLIARAAFALNPRDPMILI